MRHPTGDNEAVEAEAPEASCLDEEPEDDGKEELHPRPTEGKTLRIQVPPDDCSSPRASGGSPEEKPKGQRYQNDPKEGYRKRSSASLLGSAKHEAIPHQAPQRWRVSSASLSRESCIRIKARRAAWKSRIREDVNMGVPTLLHLLEPEIVFQHAKSLDSRFGKVLEGQYTDSNDFLQFFHRGGQPAFGVYEGSYRDLLGALQDLIQMLRDMVSVEGMVIEMPTLLIEEEVLPAWEDYKPRLSSLPKEPEKHQLKVSPFEPPLFEPTMPFMAPALVQVPDWVDDWKDVADPEFSEPPELEVPDFEPPDPSAVERPEMPRPPLKLRDVAPEYGEDWTGLRPFQWEEGQWEPLEKKLVQEYKLPPKRLTAPPVLEENLEDKTLRLDVDPVPKLEMIWRMPGDADIDGEAKRGTQPPGPVLWLNWETPFEDPPPDLSYFPPPPRPKDPTKPVLSFPDPKPMPQELPPALLSDPEWEEPDASLPEWQLPLEPLPMGFMRGVAPLVIMDVSGTMSPTMRGLFLHMKECVAQVLDPDQGELATASAVFDVITFNGGAWAWSSSYNAYQAMLEDTLSGPKTGRPHGGRIASGRGGGRRVREAGSPLQALMPTEAEYLREAQKWVKAWPEARGSTNLIPAIEMVKEYSQCDGVYLFSDGLMNDPMKTLKHVEQWMATAAEAVPPMHTIGFFPINAEGGNGERFLKQIALLTGGTYRRYDPTVRYQYSPDGEAMLYDLQAEPDAVRNERLWVEEQLRAARRENLRIGVFERLEVTIARVQEKHRIERIEAEDARLKRNREQMWSKHLRSLEETKERNERIKQDTVRQFVEDTQRTVKENELGIKRAKANFEADTKMWEQECLRLEQEWLSKAEEGIEATKAREELRSQILSRFQEEWAVRRQAIAVGSTEALAAIAESMHNASEEVVAGLPPSQQEAAAELAKVLVGAEIRNSKKDQELVASWEEQFRQLEAANQDLARRRRLREEAISTFREDISNDYAVDLVNLLVMRHAKQEAVAQLEVEMREAQRARELAAVRRKNRDTRIKHHEEVAARKAQQRSYDTALSTYKANKVRLEQEYKDAIKAAEDEYEKVVATAKARHDMKVQLQKEQWKAKRERMLAAHHARIEQNAALNEGKRDEVKKQQRAHLDAKARNEALMAKARERYDELCKAEREAHEENLERLREEYLAECEKLAADQEANYSRSHEDWKELCKLLEMKNKELMDDARARYQADFGQAKGTHKEKRAVAISAHEEAIRKAEEHNAIWKPRIERAAIAARELERVMVFFEAIRLCASKMEIGVNLMPEPTPALDRVVEMSSLIGSLREAYKEFALDELPWPEKAWAGQVGTGWTFVPPFKDMTGKSRESINTSIKQEAERRLSARHRQAIKEAAVDAALQQLDPLGLREMTREQVAKEGTEVVEDWRRRLEMGAATPMRWRSASARRCKQRQREQHERQPEAPQSAPRPSTAPLSRQATLSRALAPAGKGQKASGRTTPHSVLSPPFSSAASSRRSSAGPARSPSGRESYQPARANALSAWEAQSRLLVSSAALRSSKTGFIHTQGEGVRLLRAEESSALVFPLVEVETFDYDEADWELY